jgi:hypothetical protein
MANVSEISHLLQELLHEKADEIADETNFIQHRRIVNN